MADKINEAKAISMAVSSNYLYYGNYNVEILKKTSLSFPTLAMQSIDDAFVFPSDLFILRAVYNCGVASVASVTAMLEKMHEIDPDKAILSVTLAEERVKHSVVTRMSQLEKMGAFYKRRVESTDGSGSVTTYCISPDNILFAQRMLESTQSIPRDMQLFFPEGQEFLRELMVSTFIASTFELPSIHRFNRTRDIPRANGGKYSFRYLWLSSIKNNIKRSIIVHPFVFAMDSNIHNEKEHETYSIVKPFEKLNAFLEYCEGGEYVGGLILIVDKEDDLLALSKHVRTRISERFHKNIMLTTPGLLRTQMLPNMFFTIDGTFVPEELQLI